jgi:F-type H+-transporting ATPase subunit epsilon
MPLHLEIVTAERTVFDGMVDMVTAPGGAGDMGILPGHAPIVSTLRPGELRIKMGDNVQEFAVGGGFIVVHDNRVIVLADSAEHANEIDVARAEAARARAAEMLKEPPPNQEDLNRLDVARRKSEVRLRIASRRRSQNGAQNGNSAQNNHGAPRESREPREPSH